MNEKEAIARLDLAVSAHRRAGEHLEGAIAEQKETTHQMRLAIAELRASYVKKA